MDNEEKDILEGQTGLIEQVEIDHEMRTAYIDYSMSVIVSRALPDVRDGLKPVQRRVLFGMDDMGLKYSGQTKKSARIVGDVMGKYHPHGDSSVYDAMVRLGQWWNQRYPLVWGQGNFGSMDGDAVAAMRYTEAKLEKMSEDVLADMDKDTVDMTLNFDDSLEEPTVLPTKAPLLLLNGSAGIAVGMATNMAPHNLGECCDAICAYIDNPAITTDELMQYIKGPMSRPAASLWAAAASARPMKPAAAVSSCVPRPISKSTRKGVKPSWSPKSLIWSTSGK